MFIRVLAPAVLCVFSCMLFALEPLSLDDAKIRTLVLSKSYDEAATLLTAGTVILSKEEADHLSDYLTKEIARMKEGILRDISPVRKLISSSWRVPAGVASVLFLALGFNLQGRCRLSGDFIAWLYDDAVLKGENIPQEDCQKVRTERHAKLVFAAVAAQVVMTAGSIAMYVMPRLFNIVPTFASATNETIQKMENLYCVIQQQIQLYHKEATQGIVSYLITKIAAGTNPVKVDSAVLPEQNASAS